jgi:AcrR family transcriptional regulator
MASNEATVARIYNGALVALARRGVDKLSMSDVCTEAGISRGTLYRYFASKEELLAAIGGHIRDGLREQLELAVEERPALDVRVDVVLETIIHYGEAHPETSQVIALEPGFALGFIRAVFPEFVTLVEDLVAPALESSPAVRSGLLTSGELAELIMRAAASTVFIPGDDVDEVRRAITALPCLETAKARA